LALGADSVLIGRPALWGALGDGADGVRVILEEMTLQLRHTMLMTGCANIKAIDYSVIY
jgi:4-hydroxymandelate oxidase